MRTGARVVSAVVGVTQAEVQPPSVAIQSKPMAAQRSILLRRTSDHFPHKVSIAPGDAIRNLVATGMSPPAGDRPWGWLPTGCNEATMLLSIRSNLGQNSSTGQTKGPEHIL